MNRLQAYTSKLTVIMILAISILHAKLSQRVKELDDDRGDIPGWAIASAAACVFGGLVYVAVSGVVTKYVANIK
jgi:hypothetical protein